MKIRIITLLIIGAYIIISCNSNDNNTPQAKQTRIFSEYLKDNFGLSIPFNNHYYLIIPVRHDCPRCINIILEEVKTNNINDSTTVIITDKSKDLKKKYAWLTGRKNIYLDQTAITATLEFGAYGTSLVCTRQHETYTVIYVKPENYTIINKLMGWK